MAMACSQGDVLYINNDNFVTLDDLHDDSTGEVIVDAAVTVTLQTSTGAQVSLVGMPYSATLGQYAGTLQSTLNLIENEVYTLIFDVVASGGRVGQWRETRVASYRT